MNKLQEKRALLALAQRFGQPPASGLVEEITRLEEEERCITIREAEIRLRIAEDLQQIWGEQHELVQSPPESPPEPTEQPSEPDPQPVQTPIAESIAHKVARVIAESGVVAPEPVLARPTKNLEAEVKRLEQWISRLAATGPGGGEVNLRYLDDVDRSTIEDNHYLRYNAPTKKFVFDHGNKNIFYGAFQSNVTQTSSATSATAMICEATDYSRGVSMTSNGITSSISRIVIANPGTYNLQFSVQLVNNGNAIDPVYIWYRQNGIDIQQTNSQVTVPSKQGNVDGAIIAGWNFFIRTTSVNEYIELMWFVVDQNHTFVAATTSQAATATTPFLPSIPSIILTVNEITIDNS